MMESSAEEELAKVERVIALLKRSKLARPPQEAVDAHERLIATTFARLRGDKSRENPEDFSDLLSKASGILKDGRQFLVEVVIACPEFRELPIVGGESPEWQVVVEKNRATATSSEDQDHSVQIELRQLDGQWKISRMLSDDVIRAHISGAAMFGDEYAGATTEETPRTDHGAPQTDHDAGEHIRKMRPLDHAAVVGTWVGETERQVLKLQFMADRRFEITGHGEDIGVKHGTGSWRLEGRTVIVLYQYDGQEDLPLTRLPLTQVRDNALRFMDVTYIRTEAPEFPGTAESPGAVEPIPFHWPARLSGYVTGANGTGIPAAEVKLTLTEQFREGTNRAERVLESVHTTADDTGKYTFNSADWPIPSAERPFVIDVLASAPEHAPCEPGLYSRAGNHKAPDSLPNVILPRGKEITGRCIDAKGKPVFRAVILGRSAYDPPSGHWQHRHGTTDLDGRFRVMVPDSHAAALWIVSDSEGNERVDIPANHDGPLQVKMRGGTSLVGRVESLSGEPVAGTLVVLQDIDRGARDKTVMVMRFGAETDEKGQFRMPPLRGEFRCFLAQASRSDERVAGESIFAERAAPPLAPVTVTLDGESRRKEITLRESRTVRIGGVMRLEDGRPVEGGIIKVFCGGVSMGRPVSGKDGRYSITLPAMQQELSISALGARNYHVRRAEHSPDEDHEDHFINLKGVTEDITNADFVFIARGENLEQPAEGTGSVLIWDLVGLGKKEEQPAGDAPKADKSQSSP